MNTLNDSSERLHRLALGWSDYRRRQWTAGIASFAFLPLAALVAFMVGSLTRSGFLVSLVVGLIGLVTFGTGLRFIMFPCPNCSRRFQVTQSGRMTNGRRCPHCGLERYQTE